MSQKQIRVTVVDLKTGKSETAEIADDYILICAGSCELTYTQTHSNGTHVLTVKGRKS